MILNIVNLLSKYTSSCFRRRYFLYSPP